MDFYPPRKLVHFEKYFYPDGIPPLISVSYWFNYSLIGRFIPSVTTPFVVAQYLLCCLVLYQFTKHWEGRRAAVVSLLVLGSSSHFLWSIGIGQETGFIALSIILVISLLRGGSPGSASVIVAALCAAACAITREYGWIALLCGVVVLWHRSSTRKVYISFLFWAILPASLWYIRTWYLMGNPFCSIPLTNDIFYVNPYYLRMMSQVAANNSPFLMTFEQWKELFFELISTSPIQFFLLLPSSFYLWRQYRDLWLCLGLLIGLWLLSIGMTYEPGYSLKVNTGMIVLLSFFSGTFLYKKFKKSYYQLVFCLCICCLPAIFTALTFPFPWQTVPISYWHKLSLSQYQKESSHDSLSREFKRLNPTCRTYLTHDPYVFVALREAGYRIIALWSPEVIHIIDSAPSGADAQRKLVAHGICGVIDRYGHINAALLPEGALFREQISTWKPLFDDSEFRVYIFSQ